MRRAMKASDLTPGDWIRRDGHQFQVRCLEADRVLIGTSERNAKWYPVDKVNALLDLDETEVFQSPDETLGHGQHVTGWA